MNGRFTCKEKLPEQDSLACDCRQKWQHKLKCTRLNHLPKQSFWMCTVLADIFILVGMLYALPISL